jgi:hypothetical protein
MECKVIFTLALISLASCKQITETSHPFISKEAAIQAALEVASTSWPEISGPQEKPSNINAEQMTLKEAVRRMDGSSQPANGSDPDSIVWYVTIDCLWLGEMSVPDIVPTPTPVAYRHYAIIIDAITGSQLETSLSP